VVGVYPAGGSMRQAEEEPLFGRRKEAGLFSHRLTERLASGIAVGRHGHNSKA
jgi:hypothetical protein